MRMGSPGDRVYDSFGRTGEHILGVGFSLNSRSLNVYSVVDFEKMRNLTESAQSGMGDTTVLIIQMEK